VSNFSRQWYMRVLLYLWRTYPCCSFFFFHSAWCFSFLLSVKRFDLYYSISRALLRPLGGVISMTVVFFLLLCFTLCPFVTKRGSNFYFWPGMYFQTGQVIFVPEWPKGEFVSILASFCVWTKSLMCKDAVNRDSTCQSIFRRLCTTKKIEDFRFPVNRPDVHLSTVQFVWTTCSSWLDTRQTSIIRPDDVSFRPDPSLYREASVPTCIRPDILAAHPDDHQWSISFRFFPSSEYGKIYTPSGCDHT